jgi:hypothetical protein
MLRPNDTHRQRPHEPRQRTSTSAARLRPFTVVLVTGDGRPHVTNVDASDEETAIVATIKAARLGGGRRYQAVVFEGRHKPLGLDFLGSVE